MGLPICILNAVAKLYERLIANRIIREKVEEDRNLNERQFGFRKGQSIIDSMN